MTDEELEALPVIGAADAARSDIKEDDLESLPIIEDDDIESLPIIEEDDIETLPIIEDEPKTQQKVQTPTQELKVSAPEKHAAETEKKPTIGLNEMAGLSYEAQTGVDAPDNAVGKHIVNVFGFAGKNLANAQMNAAQALIDGSERNDADTNRILSRMLYGDIGGTVASWFSVPDVLEEWDAGEGQRYTDKGERTKARNAFAAGIANQFIADRTRTQQDAQKELQTREKTFGAETMSDLENTAGYMVPFAMGPVGIAAQFLTGAIGNAEGLANDQYGFDNDGNLIVTAKGDDANTAAAKGIISSAIETGVEVIGGKLAGKVIGGLGQKIAKMAVGKFPIVKEVSGKLVATPIGQTVAKTATALNKLTGWASRKLHIDGLGEEYIEEWLDPTLNAVMGTDTKDSEQLPDPGARVWDAQRDFFTVDNQQRLITSLIILQGAGNLIAYCAERKRMNVVDDYLRKNGLMTDEEISEKSTEDKAQAMNEYVASLSEGKITEILNRTADMADGAAASIADEVTKPKEFTPEQNIALDETIPQFVGASEPLFQRVKERIREKLTTGQLGGAQASGIVDQLDDPKQREDLVMRTVEEILHEDNMAEIDRAVNVKTVGFGWQEISGKLDEAMPRTADTVTSGYAGRVAAANPQMNAERVWEIAEYVAANEATAPELRSQLEQGKDGIEAIEKLMSEDGAGIVPVEQPDGSFKTVNEVEAESGKVQPETPENQEQQPAESDKSLQWTAVQDKDNVWHAPLFPEVKITIQDEDGGKVMLVDGLPDPTTIDNDKRTELGRFLQDLLDKANRDGIQDVDLGEDPSVLDGYGQILDDYRTTVQDEKYKKRANGVLGILEKSGLAAGIVTDQETFDQKLAENGGQQLVADGQTYGWTDGQNVYLNPKFFGTRTGLNTPIHEFGHLAIIATKKINRPLYDKGIELIKKTRYWSDVSRAKDYRGDSEENRAQEALTRMIADRGELLDANTPKSVVDEIKQWLVELWKSFGKSLGIRDLTPEMVEKMSVEDIADAIRAEMMSGREFGTEELSLQEGDLKAKILRFAKYQKPTSKNAKAALDAAKKAWKGLSEEQKTALGQYGDTAVLKTPEARTIANGVKTLREWDARRAKISAQVKEQIRKSPNEAQKKFITSSPKYYISEVAGDTTSPFAYAVEKGLPIPRKGDWGWDAWERLTDGMKYKERRELEKIIGGEHPKRGGMDTVLSDYAQWLGISWDEGARDFEHGRGIEDFLDDILKERERFEKWRSGDRMTREDVEEDAWVKEAQDRRVEAERMGEQDGIDEPIPFSRAPLQFAIGKKENDSWINAVDDYVSGKIAPRTDVTVLPRVPTVISRVLNDVFGIGTEGKEIVISSDSIKKAMIGKHRIGADEMKKLAVSLDAPLAVFQSKTRPMDSITALIPIRDANGGISSIVPIDYTARTSNGKLTLRITSVYGKTSAEAVQEWIDKGYLLYADRKNISRSFPHRLQLPGRTKTANRFLDENDFSEEALGIVSNPVDDGNGAALKERQFEIIQRSNKAQDDIHAWIRSVDDIKTAREAFETDGAITDGFAPDAGPDVYTEALKTGRIKVYSSKPIENGNFVTPSRMEAKNYAGDGPIYEAVLPLDSIAWLDAGQGQVANVDQNGNGLQFSRGSRAVFVGGRTRVADDAEHGERSPGGLAAARELADVRNSPVSALGARRFLSLSISDMEELRKIVTGDVVPTAVAKNLPSGGIATRRGNVTLHSDVIGTVDRTDMDAEKATLKAHGFFRNEDPSWSMGQTDAAIRAEKQRSDAQLERQLIALGERRINRQEPGAQTAERGVFADQVAKIVMAERRHVGGRLGRLQTVGKAVQDAVANMPGMNAGDTEWQAKRFLDWAYGIPDYSQNMSGNELTAEMFGKWLVMPKEVEARAPEWANGIEGVIAGDRNLADAFRTLADRRLHGDEYLIEKIRKQMSRETQETLNRLNNEKDEPISAGSTWKDLTEQFIYGMHDRFGPVYIRMDAETKTKIKAMKKALKAAPPAARPALKQQLDLYLGNLADKLNKLELARTAYERGNLNEGSVYHREMLRLENEATERWGLTTEDMSFYLDQWRVIETSGRSASFGEDVVQARRALGDMANRLGAQKWRRMQEFGNRWWAVHERELLDDPRAERMFGKAWIDYLRQNTHYVATERVHSQEEIDAIDSARRAARAAGVAGGDDIVSQCYDYAGAKGAGKDIGEGGWTARMTGSFAAKADVRGATLKKVDRLQRALRRNQLVLDLRDALEFAGVKGVRDLPRSEGAEFPSGSRYGHLNYIENGKKRTLVVPRQIADAFATGETANWYTKTTRMIHNTWRSLIIDWNPAYWPMNVRRNQDSIEKNVPGMRETYLKTALRATFPGLGTLSDLALQTVVRNIPATAKAFSDKTVFYYIPQAERICKIVESPSEWQQMYWDAQDRNDLAKIQQMNEDWRLAKEMLKANMFVSIGSVHRGENSQTFAADQFAKKGLRTIQEIDRALQSRSRGKRALDTLCWVAKKNQAQQEHEDVLAKAIAYLADRKHFGLVRTSAESGDLVNRRVSIAQGERKGAAAGTMKLIIPFYNMIEKGVVRHFNAYKTDFGHTLGADAKFVVGRVAGSLLANGVALTWMLNNCDGDEEKARKKFGIFFRYAKAYHDAYRNCSEYVRKNYQFTPFWTKGYTSIIIGGAMTDEEKLLSPIVDYTANSIAASEGIGEMPSFGSAILDSTVRAVVPDLQMTGPIIEGLRLAVVAATGENQTDYFRDAPMFDQRTLDNRFASAEDFKDFAAAVGARLWNYAGGRSVIAAGVNGVDNGRGEAPKPVEWALSDIPWISPLVNRMVKIQVGSPDKDTAAIKAQRKSIDSLLSVCAERMLERKRDGMAFHEHDWKGYEAQIQKYAQTYKLDEFDVAKLKEKYLNGFQQWKCRDAYDQRTVIKMKEEARRQGRTESAVWVMLGER